MKPRRSQSAIFYDLLLSIEMESTHAETQIRLTNIQLRAKIAYDKVKPYIQSMEEMGLITSVFNPRVTQHGRNYMVDYLALQAKAYEMALKFKFTVGTPSLSETPITTDHVQFILELNNLMQDVSNKINMYSVSLKE